MHLTSKGNYAIAALIVLANQKEMAPYPLKAVSEKLDLSELYLRQLFMLLSRHHVVHGTRGANGGYKLAKNPEDITVYSVVTAVEGDICVVPCLDKGAMCDRKETCVAKGIWDKLNKSVEKKLISLTLADLLEVNDEDTPGQIQSYY